MMSVNLLLTSKLQDNLYRENRGGLDNLLIDSIMTRLISSMYQKLPYTKTTQLSYTPMLHLITI